MIQLYGTEIKKINSNSNDDIVQLKTYSKFNMIQRFFNEMQLTMCLWKIEQVQIKLVAQFLKTCNPTEIFSHNVKVL